MTAPTYYVATQLDVPTDGLRAWVEARPEAPDLRWWFAEFDDGALWGRVADGRLITAADAYDETWVDREPVFDPKPYRPGETPAVRVPPVRLATLRRLLAFGPTSCLRLRHGRRPSASLVRHVEHAPNPADAVWLAGDERRTLLSGSVPLTPPQHSFTLALEPTTGTRHAVPRELTAGAGQRATVHWRDCRPRLDPADPDTYLGLPVAWVPFDLSTASPQRHGPA